MSRLWVTLVACGGLALAQGSFAAPPDKDQGAKDQGAKDQGAKARGGKDGAAQAGKGAGKAKHQHKAKNGRALLGAKLKQDGKHAVGKFKNRDVVAEVKGGKVRTMSAGDIAPKRVRTKTKMAEAP